MKKGQQGFGAPLIIVAVLVVAIIGLLSVKFVAQRRAADVINKAPASSQGASKNQLAAQQYIPYQNRDLGFSFSYPKQWKSFQEQTDMTTQGKTGAQYMFQLGDFTKLLISAQTKDWLAPAPTGQSTWYGAGFDNCANGLSPASIKNTVYLYKDTTTCLAVVGYVAADQTAEGNPMTNAAVLVLQKQFTGSSKIGTIDFEDAPVAVKGFSNDELKEVYASSYGDGQPVFTEGMTHIAKTLQEVQ